jgi:hypothetical protein
MSRNEARELEDMNPAEGLDEFLTPLNMTEGGESGADPAKTEGAHAMKKAIAVCSRRGRAPGYTIQAAADGEADVLLYDEIGFWGIQAKPFIQELQALDVETIHLRINSPGGASSTASRSPMRSGSSTRP